jgi:predicted nucleic acid-binding protein
LTELAEVLVRPWATARLAVIGLAPREVLARYISGIEIVTPTSIPAVVARDPDDDQVIAAALAARAHLVISGDRALLDLGNYGDIRILNAADALLRLRQGA